MKLITILIAVCAMAAASELDDVKAEANLEKRAEKAINYSSKIIDGLRPAYESGEGGKLPDMLEQVRIGVDLAVESLEASGKNARKSPKYFKKAELKVRDFVRRLTSIKQQISVEDRAPVDNLIHHLDKVHEDLLHGLMGKS